VSSENHIFIGEVGRNVGGASSSGLKFSSKQLAALDALYKEKLEPFALENGSCYRISRNEVKILKIQLCTYLCE